MDNTTNAERLRIAMNSLRSDAYVRRKFGGELATIERVAATPNPVRAKQQGLGAGGRYWRERAEFWRAQAVALGWREVRDAANGEQPEGKGAYTLPPDTGPFADWLAREMPAGTVISNPHWWAPRILRQIAMLAAAPAAPGVRVDEAMVGDVRADIMRSAANDGCPIVIKDAWVREALTAALAPDGGEGE